MRALAFGTLALLSLGLGGCLNEENGLSQEVVATGTVHFVDLEGGFYGLVAEDGARYLPLNLPKNFQAEGMRVRFRGKLRPEVVTIQQWGTPLELLEIERAP